MLNARVFGAWCAIAVLAAWPLACGGGSTDAPGVDASSEAAADSASSTLGSAGTSGAGRGGDPATDATPLGTSSGSRQDSGGLPVADSGGLPVADSGGLPVADSGGLHVADSGGLPVADSGGLHVADSGGLPVADSGGLHVADSGSLPVADSGGLPVADSGGLQVADSGVSSGFDGGGLGAISVTTNRYDNLRSGANLSEATLTPASVGGPGFKLLYSERVDGQVYAQPLYLAGVTLSDGTKRDLLIVATEHNTVFAFDARASSGSAAVWTQSLGPSGSTLTGAIACDNLTPEVGITATPVIDAMTGTLYVVSKNYDGASWSQSVHALDVTTGKELPGSPKAIAASVRNKSGSLVAFDPMLHLGRPGLLLEGGVVYMAFASHCDIRPYHGWILGYEFGAAGFTQTHVFNVSPNGSEGGIWQAGVGLSSDGSSLYFAAGNGSTDPTATPPDLSEGVVRLSLADFSVADYWIPTAYASFNASDADLSTGAILLPHNLLTTGSKGGTLYLLDRSNLGKYSASSDGVLQSLTTPGKQAGFLGHLHSGPVYYAVPGGKEWLFAWPEDSQLVGYSMDPNSHLLQTNGGAPTASGNFAVQVPGHPGGIVTLSALAGAAGTGILWASTPMDGGYGAWHKTDTGMFYAVDASDITHVLWKSAPLTLDDGTAANFAKFNSPIVANGRVYLATFSNAVNVYGLR